jgi:hypothetical protein
MSTTKCDLKNELTRWRKQMLDWSFGEFRRKIFSWNRDSVEDVFRVSAFGGRVPGRQLREMQEGADGLEKAATRDWLLRQTRKKRN